mgnify:CR=1 FL=1
MTASYPSSIRTWPTRLDWKNILWAAHVNDLQEEVDATQRTLGLTPHISRADPGGLTRDYGTVEARMTAHARGEALPFFRAQAIELVTYPGEWTPVPITAAEAILADPFRMADGSGVRLNAHGLWVIHARTEWQATGYTLLNQARRMLRVLINGSDVGLSDYTGEDARNSFTLHNQVSWQEVLPRGTTITVQVRTDLDDAPSHELKVNVDLRLYLVRCVDEVPAQGKIVNPADLVGV